MTEIKHVPVMLETVLDILQVEADKWYLDATFGRGGHTNAILQAGGKVIAFDFDQEAIEFGQIKFADEIEAGQLILIHENFDQLQAKMDVLDKVDEIEAIFFDLGTSVEQLTSTSRGLSFSGTDDELDMRLDQRLGVKAKDLLAVLSEKQLQQMFSEFGGETEARTLAKAIIEQRNSGQLPTTVGELVKLIETHKRHNPRRIHPATKVFQALRIAVNSELDNLELALPQALTLVRPGGKILAISFHEGEDRIVKHTFRDWEDQGLGERTPSDIIVATESEISSNPNSRSAKLRVFTKNIRQESE